MGFKTEDAQTAIGLHTMADQIILNRTNIITDIDSLEAETARMESDGNRKTRVKTYMNAVDDEGMSEADFKAKIKFCREFKVALESLPEKPGAKTKE